MFENFIWFHSPKKHQDDLPWRKREEITQTPTIKVEHNKRWSLNTNMILYEDRGPT